MKELRFEEKGTWVELKIEDYECLWDSNQRDYKQWPENITKGYAKELLEFAKTIEDNDKKEELFFEAKGRLKNKPFFKLRKLFKDWSFNEEDSKYIKETEDEAKYFFETGVVPFL
ncbi:hypothetical protein MZM54_04795 [[Brevibacterium] frigoritolerans]|nr:hypothetical protein [Peribacillus frigoritolerans]